MNRILKRPMFRIGGSAGTGITSGLDQPRQMYSEAGAVNPNPYATNLMPGTLPGFLTSISLKWGKDYPWEIRAGRDRSDRTQNTIDEFINKWITPYDVTRVYYWEDDETINYGSVITINGVSELHYISITK